MKHSVVAITGGIGSGKSVVSRMLRVMGYPVYDCDSRARVLMDGSELMKSRIAAEVCPGALSPDGSLQRRVLADAVFASPERLAALNAIVHGGVRLDLQQWVEEQASPVVFVETAILYESGFDSLASAVWEVTAPQQVRLDRVMRRNGLSRDEVLARMASQQAGTRPGHQLIDNSGTVPLLPQILNLLKSYE